MSHCLRFPSDVMTNAPLRVPTSTRTPLIPLLLPELRAPPRGCGCAARRTHGLHLSPYSRLGRLEIDIPVKKEVVGYQSTWRSTRLGLRGYPSTAYRVDSERPH